MQDLYPLQILMKTLEFLGTIEAIKSEAKKVIQCWYLSMFWMKNRMDLYTEMGAIEEANVPE